MTSSESDFKAWVDRLVQACLPLELQRKLLSQEPLTKADAKRYVDVMLLVIQARQFGQNENVLQKLEAIARENRRNGDLIRETLWHASGKLPQYKPTDKRSINAVKQTMVQTAIGRIHAGTGNSPRTILNAILGKYKDIPGAYESLTPFLRQVKRVLKKSEHNSRDMF